MSSSFPTRAGGTGNDRGYGITSLGDGSSIVTGYFEGTASFGDTTLTSAGGVDVFTAKLNRDGSYAWAKQAGGTGADLGLGITSLADGSLIVTGYFSGTASFGDTTLTSAGDRDVFTAVLDANGNWLSVVPAQSNGVTNDPSLPRFVSAATNNIGSKVILTYNERLKHIISDPSCFTVTTGDLVNTVTNVFTSGATVELTLSKPANKNQLVKISYNPPSIYEDNAIQDLNGNRITSLENILVSNGSTINAASFIDKNDSLGISIGCLYAAAFSRVPGQEEYQYWRETVEDPLVDYSDVANIFCHSPEFALIAPPSFSNQDFIIAMYANCFGREPDPIGLNSWTNELNIGLQDRCDVMMNFANSSENIALFNSLLV